MLWGFLHHFAEPVLKRWPFSKLRDKALGIAMEHVHYEDKNSRYLCIGCVEKVVLEFTSNILLCYTFVLKERQVQESLLANIFLLGVVSHCLLGGGS